MLKIGGSYVSRATLAMDHLRAHLKLSVSSIICILISIICFFYVFGCSYQNCSIKDFFKEAILCPLFRICLCEAHPPEKHNVLWLVGWISVLWFCRPLWACFGNVTLLAIITTSFNTLLTQLNHPFILHVPWAGII